MSSSYDDLMFDLISKNASRLCGDQKKDLEALREAIKEFYSDRHNEVNSVMKDPRTPSNISRDCRSILDDLRKQEDALIFTIEKDPDKVLQLADAVRKSKSFRRE
jgi:hypothetical protein